MSKLRRELLKLAHTNPELRDSLVPLLAEGRTAGTASLFMKNVRVGPSQIKKAAYASKNFTREFLDSLDFGRIDFGKIMYKWMGFTGPVVLFKVYPKGEHPKLNAMPQDEAYLEGYIGTEWVIGSKGIEITGTVSIAD